MKDSPIGKLRTAITVKTVTRSSDTDGVPTESESTALTAKCWWVNAHGTEATENLRLNLGETATITMRYSSLVTVRQRVYRSGDTAPWEIVSIDNVDQRGRWTEIKLRRTVVA